MIDFKIKRGSSTDLDRIIVEEGCWYLCTDTAELFLGAYDDSGELVLKQINGNHDIGTGESVNSTVIAALRTEIDNIKDSLNDCAKKTDIPDTSKFITEVPAEYITESELESKGYLTQHQSLEGKADKDHRHDDLYDVKGTAEQIKNELLNGAGAAYDTLKELGDLISDNQGAIEALENLAANKADKEHIHNEYLTEHQSLDHLALKDHKHEEYLTTHQDISHLATKSEIPVKVSELENDSNYLTSIPSTYITEAELEAKNYLTEHQSLAAYATKTFVENAVAENQPNLTAYAKKSDIPDVSGFITSIPTEYVTESELNAKGYLTEHIDISGKADKVHSHPEYLTEHQSLAGYATETFVTTKIAEAELNSTEIDLSGYATKDDIKNFITEVPVEYITETELTAKGYATGAYVDSKVASITVPDLEPYAKKTDIPTVPTKVSQLTNDSNYLTEIPSNYITESELEGKGYLTEHQDLSDYAKKSDIPDVSGFITNIPEEYITESELSAKGFLTEHQDISSKADLIHTHTLADITDYAAPEIPSLDGYATEQYVNEAIAGIKIPAAPDMSTFITMEDVEARGYLTAVPSEYITETELNAKGYLTQHQSLAGLATEEFVTQKIAEAELADKDVDLSAYYTKTEVDALIPEVPTNISAFDNDAGYVTEQDIADAIAAHEGLAKKEDVLDVKTTLENEVIPKVDEIEPTVGELKTWVENKEYLQDIDLEGYATEDFVNKVVTDIEIPSIDGLASVEYVNQEINKINIPEVDLSGLVSNETFEVELAKKANDVPFTSAKFVGVPMGNFKLGDSLADMTIAEIFAKLLGLTDTDPTSPVEPDVPETPEEIVADIVKNKTPMYSVNSAGEIVELSYDDVTTYTEETAAAKPEESGFYQITNDAGEVIESGYQEVSVENPNVPYIIALPVGVDFSTMVEVQTYDDLQSKWVENTSLSLSNNFDEISALCGQLGVNISHIDTTKYTLWANLEAGPSGEIYRFIIK